MGLLGKGRFYSMPYFRKCSSEPLAAYANACLVKKSRGGDRGFHLFRWIPANAVIWEDKRENYKTHKSKYEFLISSWLLQHL